MAMAEATATEPVMLRSYVAGEWMDGSGAERVDVNPARPDEVVAVYRELEAEQLSTAVESATRGQREWRRRSVHERAEVLDRAAGELEAHLEDLAVELTREQGKTLAESQAEVRRAIQILRFNASLANDSVGDVFDSLRSGERVWTFQVPVGPVTIITPWNVPLAIPTWKIAPALVFGNAIVWKPASLVPLMAYRLMAALERAGLPAGVCNLVLASGAAAEGLVANPAVRAAAFTGSTDVGQHLIALGAAHGTKVQAEMGGKNAAVVLGDADLEWAVDQVLSAAMYSTGQRCTATSRVLVDASLYEGFVEQLAARASGLRVGDPLASETELGPLASEAQQRQVLDYFALARREGGVRAGGDVPADLGAGFWAAPTVVTEIAPEHLLHEQGVFGPLVVVRPVESFEEALELANRGRYGLSGAVFTKDLGRVLEAIESFEVGVLHVNSETCGADPHVPFGGVKDSGTASREMGRAARDFYTETKTVYLRGGAVERS
jgi:acyl-CoA reductase-like NAD-dependent aldehyde dehydrogenase